MSLATQGRKWKIKIYRISICDVIWYFFLHKIDNIFLWECNDLYRKHCVVNLDIWYWDTIFTIYQINLVTLLYITESRNRTVLSVCNRDKQQPNILTKWHEYAITKKKMSTILISRLKRISLLFFYYFMSLNESLRFCFFYVTGTMFYHFMKILNSKSITRQKNNFINFPSFLLFSNMRNIKKNVFQFDLTLLLYIYIIQNIL